MAEKKRILFVDDEPNVLAGLQRMLRAHRDAWEMVFVNGGAQALDRLAREPFHVIVSDMRMPGMDGAQLLNQVMQRYPDVVRIILSGQSDREMILKSVGMAHQFLSKPCDADVLKATVERACELRAVLKNEALRGLVSRIDTLPSLPIPYLELLDELRRPDASVERVGRIIARDMGMTVKILQLVNSAFFGLRQRVTDAAHAASLLGLDTIKALVLSVQVFKQFDQASLQAFSVQALWEHSLGVGAFAHAIAKAERQTERFMGDALMAGLLHDIGKLVFGAKFGVEWAHAAADAAARGIALCEMERKTFGASHAELGAYLLGLWGMGYPIVEALVYHHAPGQCVAPGFSLLTTVHVANILEHEMQVTDPFTFSHLVDAAYLEAVGLTARLPVWRDLCRTIEREDLQCMKKSY